MNNLGAKTVMRWIYSLLLLVAACANSAAELPPGELPIKVRVGFFLSNLSGVDEKAETFDADIYILLQWRDARLKHASAEPLFYIEDAVLPKLNEIWTPQPEFVNTAKPDIKNASLRIKQDGSVELFLALRSNFRTDLNLRRFPFDHQTLAVRIASFSYPSNLVRFEVNENKLGFNRANTYEGLWVKSVSASVGEHSLVGWDENHSIYTAQIDVNRSAEYYFWTVFGPVALIFLISSAVYLVPPDQISDRISICLTALLACIAAQLALSFSLPQISYMTLIDRVFVITYSFIALNVLIMSAEMLLVRREFHKMRRLVNRSFGISVPILYLVVILLALNF